MKGHTISFTVFGPRLLLQQLHRVVDHVFREHRIGAERIGGRCSSARRW